MSHDGRIKTFGVGSCVMRTLFLKKRGEIKRAFSKFNKGKLKNRVQIGRASCRERV